MAGPSLTADSNVAGSTNWSEFLKFVPLRFRDPELEAAFRSGYPRMHLQQVRVALILAAALIIGDVLADMIYDPATAAQGAVIRLGVVLPGQMGLLVLTFFGPFQRVWQIWISLLTVAMSGALFWALALIDRAGGAGLSSWVGILNFTFVVMFAFVLLGLEIRYALPASAAVFVLFLAMLQSQGAFDGAELVYFGYHVLTVLLLAAFIGYWREIFVRRDYYRQHALERERQRSDELLYAVMPERIAGRIKNGEFPIADAYGEATVLFADLSGSTALARRLGPQQLVDYLNTLFSSFDRISTQFGLEKIKTIGDAYMAVSGAPKPNPGHAEAALRAAIAMRRAVRQLASETGFPVDVRIGLHTGALIGGVIGLDRYQFDFWGDTVNTAARIEASCTPGEIQVSETTYWQLHRQFELTPAGRKDLPGIGLSEIFVLAKEPDGAA